MSEFKVGDRVRVKAEKSIYASRVGTIVRLRENGSLWAYPLEVDLDPLEQLGRAQSSLGFREHELEHYRQYPATQDLLKRTEEYPKARGTWAESNGFDYSRDELIALLQECSPRVTIGVHGIDHYEPSGDSTTVRITVYATFSRGEVDMPPRKM